MTFGVVRPCGTWWMRLGALLLVAARPWCATAAFDAPTPPPAPTRPALSVSEIVRRSDEARVRLQDIEQAMADDDGVLVLEGEVARLNTRSDKTFADTARRLAENPTLSVVTDLRVVWQQIAADLGRAQRILTKRGEAVEALAAKVAQLAEEWGEVRASLVEVEAPAEVQTSADEIARTLAARRGTILAKQGRVLALQERVSRSLQRTAEADAEIAQWLRGRLENVLRTDTMPLWRQPVLRDAAAAADHLTRAVHEFARPLRPYLETRSANVAVQLLLVLVLAVLLRVARGVVSEWPQRTPEVAEFLALAQRPVAAAVMVGTLVGFWAHANAPRILWVLVSFAAIVGILRIASRLIEARLVFLPYALMACATVAMLRGLLGSSAPLLQCVLVCETALASGLTIWVVRRRADRFKPGTVRLVRVAGTLLSGLLATATVLACAGYLDLTQFMVQLSLGSVYLALVLFLAVRVVSGLVVYLLRVRPLTKLRLVRRNRDRIQQLVGRVLTGTAAVLWAYYWLLNTGLFDPVMAVLVAVIDLGVRRGDMTLTLGDLVEFGVTLWVTWLLSHFIRFVLEEDVYPRVTMPRGVSYALSNLVQYTVLTIGFFLALAVAGFDLTKATILAGALGVGVGFGLQNIVNNFVSGLILLFERPVQVGDAVTVGTVGGQVRHIGIRSSTVRTWDGAEVIFPNSALIADPVTNWTLSDRKRRLTLTVGVAYGTDPAAVVELLRRVAVAQEAVMKDPEPQALFMGFGDSALNFELRAWTDRADAWAPVQSELYLAVHAALTGAGITIPFPQRDVHFDAAQPVPVQVVGGGLPVAPPKP
jgi:potassium-dependent mechanosensitive channel